MSRYEILNTLLHVLIFFLGAGIGSFLNVVIYRLPRGLSVNQPRRSFCPSCNKQIPWYENIPIVSWILLRGRCSKCGCAISPRYIGVEVLVGVLFYLVFLRFGGYWWNLSQWGPSVLALWVFVSLVVSGTFIDIEHLILPHEITIGGTVAGLLFSFWAPQVIGADTHVAGLLTALGSAAAGMGVLWAIVELGKLAFGRLRFKFTQPEDWQIVQPNEEEPPVLRVQGEEHGWADIFMRDSDRLIIKGTQLRVNDRVWSNAVAEIRIETLKVKTGEGNEETFNLEDVKRLEGTATEITIPREAMGFGDVLFLMMIGSFLGWKAVLFTIFAASVLGSVFAIVPRLLGREDWSAKIPFGPYLGLGSLIWVFTGPAILAWYVGRISWH